LRPGGGRLGRHRRLARRRAAGPPRHRLCPPPRRGHRRPARAPGPQPRLRGLRLAAVRRCRQPARRAPAGPGGSPPQGRPAAGLGRDRAGRGGAGSLLRRRRPLRGNLVPGGRRGPRRGRTAFHARRLGHNRPMNAATLQELPAGLDWLNATPASLNDLRGRPVVLAFVNAASAWCTQRLQELANWQARNPGRLHVLVLQVPRFDCERQPQRSLKLLRRHGNAFPALLDADWAAWQRYGIESWPTLLLVDAEGRERERIVGLNGDLDRALSALAENVAPHPDGGRLVETVPEPRLSLRFPSAVAASADRLFIADSGHHRILEC